MAYPIERKLVVAVSTTALFDLETEDEVYKKEGIEAYKKYQETHKNTILNKGMAFPFIRRFLNINKVYSEQKPVEVVLLSKKCAENDHKYIDLEMIEKTYPPGTQVCAQIVSVQNYGLFIEFDLHGRGMIHKTNYNNQNIFNDFEEGNWLIAEIIEYNTEHERFSCKIIEL